MISINMPNSKYSHHVQMMLRHLITLYEEIEVLHLTRRDCPQAAIAIEVLESRCVEIKEVLRKTE